MVGLRASHSRPKKVRESIAVAAGASPAINNAIIYPSSQGERTPSNLEDEIRVIVGPSQASGLFWSLDWGRRSLRRRRLRSRGSSTLSGRPIHRLCEKRKKQKILKGRKIAPCAKSTFRLTGFRSGSGRP